MNLTKKRSLAQMFYLSLTLPCSTPSPGRAIFSVTARIVIMSHGSLATFFVRQIILINLTFVTDSFYCRTFVARKSIEFDMAKERRLAQA